MASKAVMDAIEARVATWPNIGACPLNDPNEVAPSPRSKFLEIEYPAAREDRIPIGTPALFRETGGIRFVVNVLTGDGIDSAAPYVEELRNMFRDKDDFAGLPTLSTLEASPAVFDPKNQAGAFYRVPFVVLYQYDIER